MMLCSIPVYGMILGNLLILGKTILYLTVGFIRILHSAVYRFVVIVNEKIAFLIFTFDD